MQTRILDDQIMVLHNGVFLLYRLMFQRVYNIDYFLHQLFVLYISIPLDFLSQSYDVCEKNTSILWKSLQFKDIILFVVMWTFWIFQKTSAIKNIVV